MMRVTVDSVKQHVISAKRAISPWCANCQCHISRVAQTQFSTDDADDNDPEEFISTGWDPTLECGMLSPLSGSMREAIVVIASINKLYHNVGRRYTGMAWMHAIHFQSQKLSLLMKLAILQDHYSNC